MEKLNSAMKGNAAQLRKSHMVYSFDPRQFSLMPSAWKGEVPHSQTHGCFLPLSLISWMCMMCSLCVRQRSAWINLLDGGHFDLLFFNRASFFLHPKQNPKSSDNYTQMFLLYNGILTVQSQSCLVTTDCIQSNCDNASCLSSSC